MCLPLHFYFVLNSWTKLYFWPNVMDPKVSHLLQESTCKSSQSTHFLSFSRSVRHFFDVRGECLVDCIINCNWSMKSEFRFHLWFKGTPKLPVYYFLFTQRRSFSLMKNALSLFSFALSLFCRFNIEILQPSKWSIWVRVESVKGIRSGKSAASSLSLSLLISNLLSSLMVLSHRLTPEKTLCPEQLIH